MKPLTGDELLANPGEVVNTCAACPRLCRDVCPTALASRDESHTPTAKAQLMDAWRRGHFPPTADDALSLYACATCGSAKATCELEVDKEWAILAGRRAAVEHGVAPPAAQAVAARYQAGGQPYEEDISAGLGDEATGGDQTRAAEVLVFAGSHVLRRRPSDLAALLDLLRAAGQPYRLHRGPRLSSGYLLKVLGREAEFQAQRAALLADLTPALADDGRIVSTAPQTVWALGAGPASLCVRKGTHPRAEHASVLLYELLRERKLPLRRPVEGTLAYADSCYLYRHLGVDDAPRRLLVAARQGAIIELAHARKHTSCCGGAGGLEWTHPTMALAMAERLLADFDASGAKTLVTADPGCAWALSQARPTARVRTLCEVLRETLES